jgi:hypothetical protein
MTKQTELKPCPFCGCEAKYNQSYNPCEVWVYCVNTDCFARPEVSMSCPTKPNGDGMTSMPLFEEAKAVIIDRWNRRSHEQGN